VRGGAYVVAQKALPKARVVTATDRGSGVDHRLGANPLEQVLDRSGFGKVAGHAVR